MPPVLPSKLGLDCAIISKERLRANEVNSMRLVGSVDKKIAIIVDDMADTCGTLVMAADLLQKNGFPSSARPTLCTVF